MCDFFRYFYCHGLSFRYFYCYALFFRYLSFHAFGFRFTKMGTFLSISFLDSPHQIFVFKNVRPLMKIRIHPFSQIHVGRIIWQPLVKPFVLVTRGARTSRRSPRSVNVSQPVTFFSKGPIILHLCFYSAISLIPFSSGYFSGLAPSPSPLKYCAGFGFRRNSDVGGMGYCRVCGRLED